MGYQKTIILGRIGKDADLRHVGSGDGTPVANFSVAVSDYKDNTMWFRVAIWRDKALKLAAYLTKGKRVLVEGVLNEPNVWIGSDGEAKGSLEMTGYRIELLGGGEDNKKSEKKASTTEEIPF